MSMNTGIKAKKSGRPHNNRLSLARKLGSGLQKQTKELGLTYEQLKDEAAKITNANDSSSN